MQTHTARVQAPARGVPSYVQGDTRRDAAPLRTMTRREDLPRFAVASALGKRISY